MAGNFSNQDSFDIKELATLNQEITPDFLEKLQSQVEQNANEFSEKSSNDGALFEEIKPKPETEPAIQEPDTTEPAKQEKEPAPAHKVTIDDSFDDNFIKKYKAKLNKQKTGAAEEPAAQDPNYSVTEKEKPKDIENLTSGNIIEKPIVQEQVNYNDSLDYLDENIKYSKYVIYIDPENTDFIESLTVKERKNLINKILREQDDIAITKKRLNMVQAIIKHSIVAIITIAIAIPVIYYTINASLEASINNYRNSQSIFKTLYKEHGKIKTNQLR